MITTEYRGKTLTYRETDDQWTCEDFAHGRGSPTLTQAKSRIDKMLNGPDEKPNPFEKVEVWAEGFAHQQGWQKITLTSKAEEGYWATNGKDRKKLSRHDSVKLKAVSPENDAAIAEIVRMETEREELTRKIYEAGENITPYRP